MVSFFGQLLNALAQDFAANQASKKNSPWTERPTRGRINENNPYERTPKRDTISFTNPIKQNPINKFTPAKTLNEARMWGVNNLGVQGYYRSFDNLELMNLVNEALYDMKQRFGNDAIMPKAIDGQFNYDCNNNDIGNAMCAGKYVDSDEAYMAVNQKHYENMDKPIQSFIDGFTGIDILSKNEKTGNLELCPVFQSDEVNQLINKYISNPNSCTLKEKISLQRTLSRIQDQIKEGLKKPGDRVIDMLNKCNIHDFGIGDKRYTTDDIKNFDSEMQGQVYRGFLKFPKVAGYYKTDLVDAKRDTFHEYGHIMHRKNLGTEQYLKMGKLAELERDNIQDKSITLDFLNDEKKQAIARKVSNYATESPLEFVAEVFSQLMLKKDLDDDVIKLYSYYGGPRT